MCSPRLKCSRLCCGPCRPRRLLRILCLHILLPLGALRRRRHRIDRDALVAGPRVGIEREAEDVTIAVEGGLAELQDGAVVGRREVGGEHLGGIECRAPGVARFFPQPVGCPRPLPRGAPGVLVGNTLYVSGQIGRDENMQLVEGTEAQIVQAFENLKKVIEAAGARMSDIVDLTSFHTDMRDLQVFMRVKDRYLTEAFPAWTAIGAAQLGGAAGYLIEIKAVAVLSPS